MAAMKDNESVSHTAITNGKAFIITASAILLLGLGLFPLLTNAKECTSTDVRTDIQNLSLLEGCTVIKGYLLIVIIRRNETAPSFNNYSFPQLREITDFLIFYDVKGMLSVGSLFPNLTVIRGRRLFLNYALVASNMPDLVSFEIPSLVAIQRGHVYIGSCPKLCYLNVIDFERLTWSEGENHIYAPSNASCDQSNCVGCDHHHCWSYQSCQKFENDNVIHLLRGSKDCHPECMGGCRNRSSTGCTVCKGLTDHGKCVPKCAKHLYVSEHHQRCYTKEECGELRNYAFSGQCSKYCPEGYSSSRKVNGCVKCATNCKRVCNPDEGYSTFMVNNIADAELLQGCHTLNGSLYIEITNKIHENFLENAFQKIEVVIGQVIVTGSPHINTLGFLKSIKRIEAQPDNGGYAFVIYRNPELQELWDIGRREIVEFIDGGIYSYSNHKLCLSVIKEFRQRVRHDQNMDSIQHNDLDMICEPTTMNLKIINIHHTSILFAWTTYERLVMAEIAFREQHKSLGTSEDSIDDNCNSKTWKRTLVLKEELRIIDSPMDGYRYTINNLVPHTAYDFFIKGYFESSTVPIRTRLVQFLTLPDIPLPPKILVNDKKPNLLSLTILPRDANQVVTSYVIDYFEQPVDDRTLNHSGFCEQTSFVPPSPVGFLDYDDCCTLIQQEAEDEQLLRNLQVEYSCNIDNKKYCLFERKVPPGFKRRNISEGLNSVRLEDLKPYTVYTFQAYACNNEGCGSFTLHSERTTIDEKADQLQDLEACHDPNTNKYHVKFTPPVHPNGGITFYVIHFQGKNHTNGSFVGETKCISNGTKFKEQFEDIFESLDEYTQVAVRVTSLGLSSLSEWVDVTTCGLQIKGYVVVLVVISVFLLLFLGWLLYNKRWLRRMFTMFRPVDTTEPTVHFRTAGDESLLYGVNL